MRLRCGWAVAGLLGGFVAAGVAQAATGPVAVRAWFTDAGIADSVQTAAPKNALSRADGTNGPGVDVVRAVAVGNPLYDPNHGMISFWLRPRWNGDDGRTHQILRVGDGGANGLLVAKAASGMLRFVVSSPAKTTAARWDVSSWKAGQWHHVAVSWVSANNRPVGLSLWVDRVCVDGPIFGADEYPRPADTRVWIGDPTAEADMDELICRRDLAAEGGFRQLAIVWRDYFRTAPFTRLAVDLAPHYGPMDPRVVLGCEKQYGLLAERGGAMEKITDFAVRYNQWSYYDAKPFITWATSDPKVVTVDANGRVTGKAIGRCTLTATFRGMKAEQAIEVIPIDQPDLDLVYVERLPKYPRDGGKDRPTPGDRVESVARIINFGYAAAPAGAVVTFQLIPDRNRNFRLDADEKPVETQTRTIDRALEPRQEVTIRFHWAWRDEPTWVRLAVNGDGKFGELCNANNERCELNIARPLEMAFDRRQMEGFYHDRKINHVGSFSEYDWINGQLARFEAMLRSSVWPTTSPDGVRDCFRIDRTYELDTAKRKWNDEPYAKDARLYDGGFPVREPIDLMAVDAAILHEYGHTCASLPDLYGYGMAKENVLLKDPQGKPYAGGPRMPVVTPGGTMLPFSSANNVPCGTGCPSLMDSCSLWLAPFEAGAIQWFAGYRGGRFWGTQGRLMPSCRQFLKVYDLDDRPLAGAAVYVYGVTNTSCQNAGTKFIADRPKFLGHTDRDGRYRFPGQTDESWDDAHTDVVDGAIKVWNPFGRAANLSGTTPDVAFTPNVWIVEGLLLVKIVSGEQTEFRWLPLTEFNTVFLSGQRLSGTIVVRTSLRPSPGRTPLVRPVVPEVIRKVNLSPIAVTRPHELTVKCGQDFTLDASKSHDPEGQPLTYNWVSKRGGLNPERAWGPVLKAKAPSSPMRCEYMLYVIDGLRCSQPVSVRIQVEK